MTHASLALARALTDTLPVGQPNLFHPWKQNCEHDTEHNTLESRIERLAAHLNCSPRYVLCGEAPGFLGCRYAGIAFTSERLLLEGAIPRIAQLPARLTSRKLPFSEPSATIVWKTLYRQGIQNDTILWNAVQLHPHKPGEIHTNRTPTDAELALGAPAMRLLTEAFPDAKVVAVGKKAEGLLHGMGIKVAAAVRHPANGGATRFAAELEALVKADQRPV